MNYTTMKRKLTKTVLSAALLPMMATPAYALDLMAYAGDWTSAVTAEVVPMWGLALDTGNCATAPTTWDIGPEITDTDVVAEVLTINLRNCLPEATSIIIPGLNATLNGQPTTSGGRIIAFAQEAPADSGATTTAYSWSVPTGTTGALLYQTGSHVAKQLQMGLYGAAQFGSYAGTGTRTTLLYSEIDPALHAPVTPATPLDYNPGYFLVNGLEEPPAVAAGATNETSVLSFLNAGLDFHVLTLNRGGYLSIRAEDGNLYPYPKVQYSVNIPAGKTFDAFWDPNGGGEHVLYDRRGNGMLARLSVNAAPLAKDDTKNIDLADGKTAWTINIIRNDRDEDGIDPTSVALTGEDMSGFAATTQGGSAEDRGNGRVFYRPPPAFTGVDTFTYTVMDLNASPATSNVATVTVTIIDTTPP